MLSEGGSRSVRATSSLLYSMLTFALGHDWSDLRAWQHQDDRSGPIRTWHYPLHPWRQQTVRDNCDKGLFFYRHHVMFLELKFDTIDNRKDPRSHFEWWSELMASLMDSCSFSPLQYLLESTFKSITVNRTLASRQSTCTTSHVREYLL